MRVQVHAVGRMKAGPEQALLDHYRKRLPFPLEIVEIDDRKFSSAGDARLAEEAEALLAGLPAGAPVVVLDETGKARSSRELADRLGAWRDEARQPVVFVIGGADGLHESVRARADLVLCFGRLTWPHMLVRALLAEQIYRAHSILAGHPYHRD